MKVFSLIRTKNCQLGIVENFNRISDWGFGKSAKKKSDVVFNFLRLGCKTHWFFHVTDDYKDILIKLIKQRTKLREAAGLEPDFELVYCVKTGTYYSTQYHILIRDINRSFRNNGDLTTKSVALEHKNIQ